MTNTALPRFVADVRLVVEISGTDEADALQRLDDIQTFLAGRTDRTTFQRLSGMPRVELVDVISDVVPANGR